MLVLWNCQDTLGHFNNILQGELLYLEAGPSPSSAAESHLKKQDFKSHHKNKMPCSLEWVWRRSLHLRFRSSDLNLRLPYSRAPDEQPVSFVLLERCPCSRKEPTSAAADLRARFASWCANAERQWLLPHGDDSPICIYCCCKPTHLGIIHVFLCVLSCLLFLPPPAAGLLNFFLKMGLIYF